MESGKVGENGEGVHVYPGLFIHPRYCIVTIWDNPACSEFYEVYVSCSWQRVKTIILRDLFEMLL